MPFALSSTEKEWLEKHQKITLGFNSDMEPLLIKNSDGSLSGVYPEIFSEIEKLIGIKLNFEIDEWSFIVKKVRKREVDGLLACTPSQAQASDLLMTNVFHTLYPVVFQRVGAPFILHTLDDLQGKRIVYHQEVKMLEVILKGYQDVAALIPVSGTLEALRLLLEDKADVVMGINFENYLIDKYSLVGVKIGYFDLHHESLVSTCIRKDWPELASIINKAFAFIGQSRIQSIFAKWIRTPEPDLALNLTEKERSWLIMHPVVTVGSDGFFAPLEFKDSKGVFRGLAVDYLKILEKKLGVRFEIKPSLNRQEAFLGVKEKKIDMLSCRENTKDGTAVIFSKPYVKIPSGIFARNDVAYIGDLKELRDKKVAILMSGAIDKLLKADYPEIQFVYAPNPLSALNMLKDKKVFAVLGDLMTTGYCIAQMQKAEIKTVGSIPYEYQFSMAIRNDWEILAGIIDKVFADLSEDEKNIIYSKWVSVKYDKEFDYELLMQVIFAGVFVFIVFLWSNIRLRNAVKRKTSELAKSEEILRGTFNSTKDGILVVGQQDQILALNSRFAEMWSISSEMISKGNDAFLIKSVLSQVEDPEGFQEKIKELYKSSAESYDEIYLTSNRIFERFSCPLLQDGLEIGRVWNFTDITERKKAEEKIKSLSRFPSEDPNPVLRVSHKHMILFANNAANKILVSWGVDKILIIPDDWKGVIDKVLKINKSVLKEAVIGDQIFSFEITPVVDSCYVNLYGRDITEIKEIEKTISIEKERAQNYLNIAGVMFLSLDTAQNVTLINPKGCEILGCADYEVIGKNWFDEFICKEEVATTKQIFNKMIHGDIKAVEYYENYILRKDGTTRLIAWHNSITRDAKGRIIGLFSSGEDITERKHAEEKIRAALAEKETLLRELYHRTKNNMQVISGLLMLAARSVENDEVTIVFNEMMQRINAMTLVHQKLYQSQDLSHIDLKDYIEELIEYIIKAYHVKKDKIVVIKDLQQFLVVIDIATPCGLILNELLSNVFKHAFKPDDIGNVNVKLRMIENKQIELFVSDTGVGLIDDLKLSECTTMGLRSIKMIAEHQLGGSVEFDVKNGFSCKVQFPNTRYKERI